MITIMAKRQRSTNIPWNHPNAKFPTLIEIAVVSYEPDDDVKEKKLVTLNSEVIPFYLEKLDDIARDNNGHMANGKVNDPSLTHGKIYRLLILNKFVF